MAGTSSGRYYYLQQHSDIMKSDLAAAGEFFGLSLICGLMVHGLPAFKKHLCLNVS